MACQAPNTIGSDGKCYNPCGQGYVPQGNSNTLCIQQCPPEFLEAQNQCVRPSLPRDLKPPLQCPPGATRIAEQCWLACPEGTVANQEVCEPACPDGFVESEDGLACEAEFVKRVSTLRNACFPNEDRIGNFCLQKCPSGMEPQANEPSLCTQSLPDNVKKQFVTNNLTSAKIIFGRTRVNAECLNNQTPAPKGCQSLCPLNSEAQGDSCVVNCPAGFTQQNSSCGRKIVGRNQATGSMSTGTFLVFLAIGGFVVLFIIMGPETDLLGAINTDQGQVIVGGFNQSWPPPLAAFSSQSPTAQEWNQTTNSLVVIAEQCVPTLKEGGQELNYVPQQANIELPTGTQNATGLASALQTKMNEFSTNTGLALMTSFVSNFVVSLTGQSFTTAGTTAPQTSLQFQWTYSPTQSPPDSVLNGATGSSISIVPGHQDTSTSTLQQSASANWLFAGGCQSKETFVVSPQSKVAKIQVYAKASASPYAIPQTSFTNSVLTPANASNTYQNQFISLWPTQELADQLARCPIQNFSSTMDFSNEANIADPQKRANEFNLKGAISQDGSTNYSEPPWNFVPGYTQDQKPLNICSNYNGAGQLGSEGLTYLNPIAGSCQKRPNQDVCMNPCVRDPLDGTLKPNPQNSQCRVFPNLGGSNSQGCAVVCPQQCVELWESCPVGTGILTTNQDTQGPKDVLSLEGPSFANGSPNPQFPYEDNGYSVTLGPWPNVKRPQKECYAQGTYFCNLPLANLQPQGSGQNPLCAATCPSGFQNVLQFCTEHPSFNFCNNNNWTWENNVDRLGQFFNGAQICVPKDLYTNPDQNITCDPNQFLPFYGETGTTASNRVFGCATLPIPATMDSKTCPVATNAQVNEVFSLEWCTNSCPANRVPDPAQTACISTCNGAIWDSTETFQQYWDQQDIYVQSGRCITGTNCFADNTPGLCPAKTSNPLQGSDQCQSVHNHGQLDSKGNLIQSKVGAGSLQKDLAFDDPGSGLTHKGWSALRNKIVSDQGKDDNSDVIECPPQMEIACNPQNGEKLGYCQDICQEGYKSRSICKTVQLTDLENPVNESPQCPEEDRIQVCMPDCPVNWEPDNRVPGVFNCTYKQPGLPQQEFPSDPFLWKTCPSDGRFLIVEQTTSNNPNAVVNQQGTYGPAMCVRKPYKRLETCPLKHYVDPASQECTSFCPANDVVLQTPTGTKCVRACNDDGRQVQEQSAMYSPNIKPNFANRYCQRTAIQAGSGSDPSSQNLTPSTTSTSTIYVIIFVCLGIVLALWIVPKIFTRINTGKPQTTIPKNKPQTTIPKNKLQPRFPRINRKEVLHKESTI